MQLYCDINHSWHQLVMLIVVAQGKRICQRVGRVGVGDDLADRALAADRAARSLGGRALAAHDDQRVRAAVALLLSCALAVAGVNTLAYIYIYTYIHSCIPEY